MLSPRTAWRAVSRGFRSFSSGIRSSPFVKDPYVYVPLAKRPALLSAAKLRATADDASSVMRSSWSIAVIKKHVPQFATGTFAPIAEDVFSRFMHAHADGSMSALHASATELLVDGLQAEIKARGRGGRGGGRERSGGGGAARRGDAGASGFVTLRVKRFVGKSEVLQVRDIQLGKGLVNGWGQVTCKLQSVRERARVDSSGTTSLGEFSSVSIGVFEVYLGDPSKTWRLAHITEIAEV